VARLLRLSERVRARRLLHLSGGRFGGGSAEMLHTLVPMMSAPRLEATWEGTRAGPGRSSGALAAYYAAVSAMRAALDGAERVITDEALDHYVEMNRLNAKKIALEADVV